MESDRTIVSREEKTLSISRPKTSVQPSRVDGHFVRPQDRHSLGVPSPGDGLRQRHDLLAAATRLAKGGPLEPDPSGLAQRAAWGRPNRLFSCPDRLQFRPSGFWGAHTGPNPTDRRKAGTKHHVLTSANGIPLAVKITGANRHDVTQLLPLVDAVPPIAGKVGRPRRRPEAVQGDRAYDSGPHRRELRKRGIVPLLAQRRTEHGSGLGVYRWPVERTLSWLHQYRRLRNRYERRSDIHEAFVLIACILICWNFLSKSFC